MESYTEEHGADWLLKNAIATALSSRGVIPLENGM
jgi:hypothetical protein